MSIPPTIFKVLHSYGIPERNYYVLHGRIQSGEVKAGMYAGIVLNPSLTMTVKIKEVLSLEHVDKRPVETLLVIHYEDELEYSLMMGMNVYDEEVTITLEEGG